MKKIISLFSIILLSLSFQAQVVTDNSNTVEYYVQNVLLGGGVIASNHSYEGDSMQIGFFNAVKDS